MKGKSGGTVPPFLTSALDGCEESAPAALPLGKEAPLANGLVWSAPELV
jgi:hypothetical protein